jgi:hypothetical protein
MRTTVRLDDELLAEAKALAARTGRTLTRVIEDALRQALSQRTGGERGSPARLPSFAGRGLRPGVSLDDAAGLLDVMEDRARP